MIEMNDFRAEPGALIEAELAAIERVMRSGHLILGREVLAFEEAFAAFCGVPECVGVGNGLDAIEIGLRAQGVGPGDEVITTPMSAFATVLAILRAGATPVLADIDPDTALLKIDSVKRCITSKTRGVLFVHLYGRMGNMTEWLELCEAEGIRLWEDCAQAHGSKWEGKSAGSWGDWGAYSFYPTKNLGALGDGGALVCREPAIASQARCLRNYGQSERYHHPLLGMNSRLDELHAAVLSERLKWLPSFNERRNKIAQQYSAQITNPLIRALASPEPQLQHCNHLYVILSESRALLREHLHRTGIQSLIHYPIPIHQQPPCRNIRTDPAGLNGAETHAANCVSVPCHPQLSDPDLQTVIQALNNFS